MQGFKRPDGAVCLHEMFMRRPAPGLIIVVVVVAVVVVWFVILTNESCTDSMLAHRAVHVVG